MGWFGKSTGLEREMEIYSEQMADRQEELNKLSWVDTAESGVRREELTQEIANLELSLEGTRSTMELQGMDKAGGILGD